MPALVYCGPFCYLQYYTVPHDIFGLCALIILTVRFMITAVATDKAERARVWFCHYLDKLCVCYSSYRKLPRQGNRIARLEIECGVNEVNHVLFSLLTHITDLLVLEFILIMFAIAFPNRR